MEQANNKIVELSSVKFLIFCIVLSLIILGIGQFYCFSSSFLAVEVLLMILSLFIFGSIRWRIDKNAITYGLAIVVFATFWKIWWSTSFLRQSINDKGAGALWDFFRHHFLTLDGLDAMFHADTLLFILGLTLFVAVITQTRLLETISFAILRMNKGKLVPTVALIAALVAACSGVLDGVSMIGLMIRTLVIILVLSKIKDDMIIYIVMISTVITTVCGMWLAYGEPPNLIMKANLYPHLDNAFFIRYCLPVAVGSYLIVAWNIRKKLAKKQNIQMEKLDFMESHAADVRFLQAMRHGEVLDHLEFIKEHEKPLGNYFHPLLKYVHQGMSLGEALVRAEVPQQKRKEMLGIFVSEDIADTLDDHYINLVEQEGHGKDKSLARLRPFLGHIKKKRIRTQQIGLLSFIPFIGYLIWHAFNHRLPLFPASFAGFAVAITGIFFIKKMRRLALVEAGREFSEYLFLIPLFFCITLLQKSGFFSQITQFLHWGIEKVGPSPLALAQFGGATILSAMLDNNVVADFAGRAIQGLGVGFIHLFAMAQIAGYALGGCWTHIGSAQSVVAYAFIRKEIDEHYTPYRWIKAMTPVIVEIIIFVTIVVFIEGVILKS
ncbi:MAG: SLC13 family permease [Sedimentisphaerales bacterium]